MAGPVWSYLTGQLWGARCLVLRPWDHQVHFPQWLTDAFGPEGRRWKGEGLCEYVGTCIAVWGTQCSDESGQAEFSIYHLLMAVTREQPAQGSLIHCRSPPGQPWAGAVLSGRIWGSRPGGAGRWNLHWEKWDASQSSGWCWRQGPGDESLAVF